MKLPLLKCIFLAVITAILVVACQARDSSVGNLNQQPPTDDCRIVEHVGGQTRVCGKPQTIAVLEPKVLSMVLALGEQPSAYADAYLVRSPQFDSPSQQIPYLGKFVSSQPINLGDRNQPSLEKLAALKPDLILGISSQESALLSSIAPTVLIDPEHDEGWPGNLHTLAKALNREDKVKDVIDSFEQQLADVRSQLALLVNTHPQVLTVISSQSMDYLEVQHHGDLIRLLEGVGFQPVLPEGVERIPGLRKQISMETLAQLDADIIFVQTWLDDWDGRSTYDVPLESLKQKWDENPLLHNSLAWQEGKIYFVDYTLWGSVISGPLADSLMLEKLPEILLSQQSTQHYLNSQF